LAVVRTITGVGSSRSMRSATIRLDTASPRHQSTRTTSGREAVARSIKQPVSSTMSTTWMLRSERKRDRA